MVLVLFPAAAEVRTTSAGSVALLVLGHTWTGLRADSIRDTWSCVNNCECGTCTPDEDDSLVSSHESPLGLSERGECLSTEDIRDVGMDALVDPRRSSGAPLESSKGDDGASDSEGARDGKTRIEASVGRGSLGGGTLCSSLLCATLGIGRRTLV